MSLEVTFMQTSASGATHSGRADDSAKGQDTPCENNRSAMLRNKWSLILFSRRVITDTINSPRLSGLNTGQCLELFQVGLRASEGMKDRMLIFRGAKWFHVG